MNWFGFGFNAFGQILDREQKVSPGGDKDDADDDVKSYTCLTPIKLERVDSSQQSRLSASWSRTAQLRLHDEDGRVYLSGCGVDVADGGCMTESLGCKDALLGERYLTLGFQNKAECWDLQRHGPAPAWSMETSVPGGYIATKPPFYRPLAPQLKAVSLALGAEHAVLLSGSGIVYTWGIGSHGQLGHSGLTPEKEPRPVEALCGLCMSSVATGGWHSACISAGGDLYVWGWNESGQLGLPSQAMRTSQGHESIKETSSCQEASTAARGEEQKAGESEEVFISIQAFPALLDLTESCDVSKVSCGSRHTAAVTSDYGQLGDGTSRSSDEPRCVAFFRQRGLTVVDVVCGPWNTFAMAAAKEEAAQS
ncbi:hypothetical protein NHX12_003366 [Muraenolepis orangiensis]|uniref:RCC1 domain-containing protein 1 n=1 Tax=Muraenolepis orangiensis TaxID=630683 RepID=A0A9Q0IH52_9TELE|nr:hypothetical protein NHX12_003366 [Muraenolepis orangiensis]